MAYLFDIAFRHIDSPAGWGQDALRKYCRARLATDRTCRVVLGYSRPKNLRVLMRRMAWGLPMIRGDNHE